LSKYQCEHLFTRLHFKIINLDFVQISELLTQGSMHHHNCRLQHLKK
jgi:hypothetical protein